MASCKYRSIQTTQVAITFSVTFSVSTFQNIQPHFKCTIHCTMYYSFQKCTNTAYTYYYLSNNLKFHGLSWTEVFFQILVLVIDSLHVFECSLWSYIKLPNCLELSFVSATKWGRSSSTGRIRLILQLMQAATHYLLELLTVWKSYAQLWHKR